MSNMTGTSWCKFDVSIYTKHPHKSFLRTTLNTNKRARLEPASRIECHYHVPTKPKLTRLFSLYMASQHIDTHFMFWCRVALTSSESIAVWCKIVRHCDARLETIILINMSLCKRASEEMLWNLQYKATD